MISTENVQSESASVSWNIPKRLAIRAKHVATDLYGVFGRCIVGLQKVRRWVLHTFRRLTCRYALGCDCVIMLPTVMMDSISWKCHLQCLIIVVVANCVFVFWQIADYYRAGYADSEIQNGSQWELEPCAGPGYQRGLALLARSYR